MHRDDMPWTDINFLPAAKTPSSMPEAVPAPLATPTSARSPSKRGWFGWNSSPTKSPKAESPRTPSTVASSFFVRTPLTHPIETENTALEALRSKIQGDEKEWQHWLENDKEKDLRRILRARGCDPEAAFVMWQGLARWRAEYKPEELTDKDCEWYRAKGVLTKCGHDKRGRPASYVDGKKHFPDVEHLEETMRAVIYMLESEGAESDRNDGDGLLCIIFDNEGVGRKNLDTNLFVAKGGVVQVLQDYYPERLGTCLILNASWIFRAMWAVVSPFLNEKTRSKVKVVGKLDDVLLYFDYQNLPPQLQQQLKPPPNVA